MLVALALAILLLGIWPAPLVEVMDESLARLLEHAVQSKL
jgi:NADH-quinone oxidoreductase subunit M